MFILDATIQLPRDYVPSFALDAENQLYSFYAYDIRTDKFLR